jgi:hypothetical protein
MGLLNIGFPKPYTRRDEKLSHQPLKDGGSGEKFATILLTVVTRIVAIDALGGSWSGHDTKIPPSAGPRAGLVLKKLQNQRADSIKRRSQYL